MVCTVVLRDTDIIWHKIYLKLRSLHLINPNSIEQEPLKLLPLFGSPKSENYYLMSQMRDIRAATFGWNFLDFIIQPYQMELFDVPIVTIMN